MFLLKINGMDTSRQNTFIFSMLFLSNGVWRHCRDKSYAYIGLIPVSKFEYNFLSSGTPRKRYHNIISILVLMAVKEKKN